MSMLDYHRPRTKERLLLGHWIPWIENNVRAPYIRACVLSFPGWVCKVELKTFWHEARAMEKLTGVRHDIDHIIPINHPRVCGLSVPENLQVIPSKVNGRKGNYWNPDQLELFT